MADLISILTACGTEGLPSDPDFQNVTLLLHGDGTNGAQNNTFLDSSTNAFTITRNGNTTQGSFSPFSKPNGSWGNYFNGSAYLSVSNAAMALGTGDFSVVFWVYRTTSDAKYLIGTSNTTGSWAVYSANATSVAVRINSLASDLIAGTITAGAWNKIEVSRTSGTLYLYVNDVLQSSIANTTNFNQSNLGIGSFGQTTTFAFTGYISNVKIIKAGTEVLNTCRSNRFVDTSPSPLTVTPTAAQITPFSPFPITTAYDPAVNGGSGYFDGTGDYLTVPDNGDLDLGTGNFCVEFWWYPQSTAAAQYPLIGDSTGNWYVIWESSNISLGRRAQGNDVSTTGFTLIQNAWQHICVTRQSTGTNDTRIFVNGVLRGVGTSTQNYAITNTLAIGSTQSATNPITGYLSNVRVIKGSVPAEYQTASTTTGTSIFTPPTAPFTAVSGTELLCNFTNAGIFDNTGFNNLETVGNAQIDTSVKKYGTGSMEFDGTGDSLIISDTKVVRDNFAFGTGDFTVEMWAYPTANPGTYGAIPNVWSGSDGWGLQYMPSTAANPATVRWDTFVKTYYAANNAVPLNQWTHIAVTRASGSFKFWINGVQSGSTQTDTENYNMTAATFNFGNSSGGSREFTGYIDDLRITKGIARYTTAFTPPTAAFPDIGE